MCPCLIQLVLSVNMLRSEALSFPTHGQQRSSCSEHYTVSCAISLPQMLESSIKILMPWAQSCSTRDLVRPKRVIGIAVPVAHCISVRGGWGALSRESV